MIVENVISNIPGTAAMVKIIEPTPKTGKSAAMHFHSDIEILYIKNGSITVRNSDCEITAEKGEIIFINSFVPHETFRNVPYSNCALFQFELADSLRTPINNTGKYFRRFINSSMNRIRHFGGGSEKEELEQYLQRILCEKEQRKAAYGLYISAELCKIIAFLYRYGILADEFTACDTKSFQKILPALKYLDENYKNEITLEELSRTVRLNPNYFCRLFKSVTGSTFTEYLNFIRVCHAEKSVASGEGTISEISLNAGFSSSSYFNRIFKRYHGCSPSAYRKIKYCRKENRYAADIG